MKLFCFCFGGSKGVTEVVVYMSEMLLYLCGLQCCDVVERAGRPSI